MSIRWRVWIDFEEDGYDDIDEITHFCVNSLRIARGREQGEERYLVGTAEITLDNRDRRFFYWNENSPYYGLLAPGKPVLIQAEVENKGVYEVFNGFVDEITAVGRYTVLLRAHDWLGRAKEATVGGTLITEQSTGTVAEAYMERAGIPADMRDVDAGATTVHYAYLGGKFGEAVRDLIEAERGRVYVNRLGQVVFEGRHRRLLPEYQEAMWTLNGGVYSDLAIPIGWKNQVDRVCVTAHQVQVADALSVLFAITQPVSVPAGGTVELWGDYTDAQGNPCGGVDVQDPVAYTDYEANDAEDGTGADRTGDLTVSISALAEKAKFRLSNGGATSLYVTMLQVRGRAITETRVTACEGEYSGQVHRLKSVSAQLLQDFSTAQSMARWVRAQLATPGVHDAVVRVPVTDDLAAALEADISQRVRVVNSWYGVDGEFFVEGVQWDVDMARERVMLSLVLSEAVIAGGGWWVLGYAALGEGTRLAY